MPTPSLIKYINPKPGTKFHPATIEFSLTEEHQFSDSKFTVVNRTTDGWQAIYPWLKCREYFNEMFYATTTNQALDIYGFVARPNDVDFTKTFYLGLQTTTFDPKRFNLLLLEVLNCIPKAERKKARQAMRLTYTSANTDTLIFTCGPLWGWAPCMLSTITILLRICCNYVNIPEYLCHPVLTIKDSQFRFSSDDAERVMDLDIIYDVVPTMILLYLKSPELKPQDALSEGFSASMMHARGGVVSWRNVMQQKTITGAVNYSLSICKASTARVWPQYVAAAKQLVSRD